MPFFAVVGLRTQAHALRSGGQRKLALPDTGADPTDGEATYRAFRARVRELSGERRLVLAVVMRALEDLRHGPVTSKFYAAAFRWLLSDDESWPLAFRPACAMLELDPGAVRARLRATVAAEPPVVVERPRGGRPPVRLYRAAS